MKMNHGIYVIKWPLKIEFFRIIQILGIILWKIWILIIFAQDSIKIRNACEIYIFAILLSFWEILFIFD